MKISVSKAKYDELKEDLRKVPPATRDKIWDAAILSDSPVVQEACREVWREEDPDYPF